MNAVKILAAAAVLAFTAAPAWAANFEVHMLNTGAAGAMVFEPAPRVVQKLLIGGENGPRPESKLRDFILKQQTVEMLEVIGRIEDGRVRYDIMLFNRKDSTTFGKVRSGVTERLTLKYIDTLKALEYIEFQKIESDMGDAYNYTNVNRSLCIDKSFFLISQYYMQGGGKNKYDTLFKLSPREISDKIKSIRGGSI